MAINSVSLSTGNDLPPPQSAFVEPKSGVLSVDGYQYILGLINQLRAALPTASVAVGLVATGLTQATALPLQAQWNEVATATVTNRGVLLTALQPGQSQQVVNDGAVSVNVYPPPGSQIDAGLTNQAFALVPGGKATFQFFSATIIKSDLHT